MTVEHFSSIKQNLKLNKGSASDLRIWLYDKFQNEYEQSGEDPDKTVVFKETDS